MTFVGNYATGSVVGSDTVDGRSAQQHPSSTISVSHPPSKPTAAHKLEGSSDCVGFQLDGPGFTEIWVVYVLLSA